MKILAFALIFLSFSCKEKNTRTQDNEETNSVKEDSVTNIIGRIVDWKQETKIEKIAYTVQIGEAPPNKNEVSISPSGSPQQPHDEHLGTCRGNAQKILYRFEVVGSQNSPEGSTVTKDGSLLCPGRSVNVILTPRLTKNGDQYVLDVQEHTEDP